MTVAKWALQIPRHGLTAPVSYVFPINPSKMSTPHAGRIYTVEHSTAFNGQPLTFEGAPFGVDWTFEGTVLTQGFYEALELWLAKPRRVYVIDHLKRAWTISLESLAWTRLPAQYNDWAHTYVIKTIIYAGPIQL